VQRAWVAYHRGELVRGGPDLFPILDHLDWAPSLGHLVTLGRITLEAGTQPLPEARAALRRLSTDDLAAIPHDEHWLLLLGHYLEGCVRTGEREGGEAAHALLLPHAEGHVVHELLRIWSAPAALVLGEAEAMLGAHAEAEAHLEAALATCQEMGARPAEARTRVALARVLRARGHRGDRRRAEAHAEAAAAAAREIGLPGVEEALRGP